MFLLRTRRKTPVQNQVKPKKIFIFRSIYSLFYLHIYPPDSQESDGGANT